MNNFGIADNSEYLKLAEELKCIAEDRKQKVAVELLDRSIKEFSTGTFSLAVLGMVKRGKSTFCNALLGANSDKYAPVGKTPVSNAITFFEKGPSRISVSFFKVILTPMSFFIDFLLTNLLFFCHIIGN